MKSVLRSIRSVVSTPSPRAAIEIAPDGVRAVVLSWTRTGPVVVAHATASLPEGAIVPSVTSTNIANRPIVSEAVRAVLDQLPSRPRKIGLAIPDCAATVSLVSLKHVPTRKRDLEELIRWKVGRVSPFSPEDTQIAFTPGALIPEGGREFVVVMIRRDVSMEYEAVCVDAGTHAGILDLASFSLINALFVAGRVGQSGDWLLIHEASRYHTLAIIRGEDLIFFRTRASNPEGKDSLADLVHQSVMYYEDRLRGTGINLTVLAEQSVGDWEANVIVREILNDRIGTPVEIAIPGVAVSESSILKQRSLAKLAAPVGLLLRERSFVS